MTINRFIVASIQYAHEYRLFLKKMYKKYKKAFDIEWY